jgi:hypothetical protein
VKVVGVKVGLAFKLHRQSEVELVFGADLSQTLELDQIGDGGQILLVWYQWFAKPIAGYFENENTN